MSPALDPAFARLAATAQARRHGTAAAAKINGSLARKRQRHEGSDAEAFVNGLHALCLAAHVARMVKIPTPMRITGQRGAIRMCVPDEKSTVDYMGHLLGGRAIYVEAKKLADTRLNFANRLPPHQRAALSQAHDEGAVSVLLIVAGESLLSPTVYAIPWSDVRAVIDRGDKSLALADMGAHVVPRGEPYLRRWIR